MNPDQVFILLATYNRAHLVTETLQSIQNQTYKDWQCIIIDDFSKDDTPKVVQEFIADDPRFNFYNKTEPYAKGLSGSRNYGLDLAQQKGAKFIQFFDDDDIVHPLNLEITLDAILKGDYDFCHFIRHAFKGDFNYHFNLNKCYVSTELNEDHLLKIIAGEIRFNSCQILWSLDAIGNERFNEKLHYAEEWEFFTRILTYPFRGISVDKVLYFARKHTESNTGEFWQGSDLRANSNSLAIKLVIDHLFQNNLLSKKMERHFFQLSVFHKDESVLYSLLKRMKSKKDIIKYRFFYKVYPIMSFAHKKKKKIKARFK